MEILIRSARIIDANSKHHLQVRDILIINGVIEKIAPQIRNTAKAQEVKIPNLHVSMGWVDLNVQTADPGFEQKETITTACKAAAAGGFTHICAMPNNMPVTDGKAQVEYILARQTNETVAVHPIGAVTQGTQGKDLADMYDMHRSGAIAFSDGNLPSLVAGVMERALMYVKAFDGLILAHPEDKSISKNGVVHEGTVGTLLGLPMMPALAEEIAVQRDLFLLEYTHSKLHLLDISTARSTEMIKQFKKKKLNLSCSVNAYQLLLNDSAVGSYNTLCKLNPPLRPASDVTAIINAVSSGVIDAVTSGHQPHETDCKNVEFDKAEFGMIGLETCFAITNTALKQKMEVSYIVSLVSNNPRKILGLPTSINEQEPADLTLFDPEKKWTFTEADIQSQSRNSPFIGQSFTGKSLGIINKGRIQLNN